MTPAQLLAQIQADRVRITLLPSGKLQVTGDPVHVNRWLASIGQYEDALIDVLKDQHGVVSTSCWKCQ